MTRARGLAGFASAISGPVNSTDVFVGVLTATSMTVNGSASIGGTVTYEDVSNVDSVGVVTARSGVHFGTAASGTLVKGDSTGIGIGTDSPRNNSKLDVHNSTASGVYINYDGKSNTEYGLRIESNAAGGNFESDFTNGTTALLDLYANSSTVTGGDLLVARTQSSTPVLLVKGNGSIGIGTFDPLRQLTVDSGTASATGGILVKNVLYGSNQDAPYLIAASSRFDGGTTNWGEYGFQHRIKSNSGGTPRVTIDGSNGELFSVNNSGNVAIGTDTAQARLHVLQPVDGGYDNSCILSRGADENFQFRVVNGSNSNNSGQPVTRFGMYYDGTGWDNYFQFTRGSGAQNGALRFFVSNASYTALYLRADGYLANPARLSGSGTVAVNCNTSGVLVRGSSDATLKENVTPIGSQYETVKALNPVTYTWIDTEFMGDQTELGFIAQEVQPHIPEVITSDVDGKLGLDYPKLTATLTKALQEAIAKIETLETKVAALEGN